VVNGSINICTENTNPDGSWRVDAVVRYVGNREETVSETLRIEAPLSLDRHVKVYNRSGKDLNPPESFDTLSKAYVITGITIPDAVILDARDVISDNPGYKLGDVTWKISDDTNVSSMRGERVTFDIERTMRYIITAEYTFEKIAKTGEANDQRSAQDTIILDLSRSNLTPILKIQQSSDYVPAKVTVDGSQSRSEYSNIITFIYDFGEGKPPAVGDAIRTYEYITDGQKEITLTVVDSNNNRASTKGYVVLKDTPTTIGFTTSLSPATVGAPVDFIASKSTGQIDDYIWNF